MILTGPAQSDCPQARRRRPDPTLETLAVDLRTLSRRAELLAAHHDPRTVPQGVADAIHDAIVALADARELLAAVTL